MVTGRYTIKFGQAVIQPVMFTQPTMDYPFFKKPVSTNVPTPPKRVGSSNCIQLSFIEGTPYIASRHSRSY